VVEWRRGDFRWCGNGISTSTIGPVEKPRRRLLAVLWYSGVRRTNSKREINLIESYGQPNGVSNQGHGTKGRRFAVFLQEKKLHFSLIDLILFRWAILRQERGGMG